MLIYSNPVKFSETPAVSASCPLPVPDHPSMLVRLAHCSGKTVESELKFAGLCSWLLATPAPKLPSASSCRSAGCSALNLPSLAKCWWRRGGGRSLFQEPSTSLFRVLALLESQIFMMVMRPPQKIEMEFKPLSLHMGQAAPDSSSPG
eukprot:1160356-Pelagomonas_calceolata.AAC.11